MAQVLEHQYIALVKEKLPPDETVLITGGALKAHTVIRFRTNARVIATLGGSE